MLTIGERVSALEEELLVGRGGELAGFRRWLLGAPAQHEILNVSGRGGIGKSTLLRAFARAGRQLGKTVAQADCRGISHTPERLLALFGCMATSDAVAHLNETRPLILMDSCDELDGLGSYLREELLPRLSAEVRLVVASRCPIDAAWMEDSPWRHIVRPMPLEAFSLEESREYLRRRGLPKAEQIEQVARVAAGNPLVLSLACDVALQTRVGPFAADPRWHLTVRRLVERLLGETLDDRLRELLDAAALVRHCDEELLAGVTGRDEIGGDFDRLCRLPVFRPTEYGLLLHDDVRQALAADLRWRSPVRYDELRLRALAYYRDRAKAAPPAERARLVAGRLFLWENDFVQSTMFGEDQPGRLRLEPVRPDDGEEIRRVWQHTVENGPASEPCGDAPEGDARFLDLLLSYGGTRLRIVRERDGRVRGFSTVLPLCQDSLPLLDRCATLASLVHAYFSDKELAGLPATPADTNIFCLIHLASSGSLSGAANAALLRDQCGLFALGGIYLAAVSQPGRKRLLEAWGFERVPEARNLAHGDQHPVDGYVLNLVQIGVERWIEAIVTGDRPPAHLRPLDVERELHAALLHWWDDIWLASRL